MACTEDEGIVDEMTSSVIETRSGGAVTLSADIDGVSVLIFGENEGDYIYQNSIASGWSVKDMATNTYEKTTYMNIGKYKCLFYKLAGNNTELSPSLLTNTTVFEDIRFNAKNDASNPNCKLPVDEIFLPALSENPDQIYVIPDVNLIQSKISRAVSLVVLNIKRGYKNEEGKYDSIPYPNPGTRNIMNEIKEIKLEINGVGESLDIYGSATGNGRTIYTAGNISGNIDINNRGFATIDGPLVFPAAENITPTVKVTISPTSDSAFPILEKTVEGVLERNKKLEITLWITDTYEFVNITVNTGPMSEMNGDIGIWD